METQGEPVGDALFRDAVSYAQRGEDVPILEMLGPGTRSRPFRKFLDIGAADGRTFSTTRLLYERGWKGTVVEPSPTHFQALLAMYATDREMRLVMAPVVPERDCSPLVAFYLSPDLVSTTDDSHRRKWEGAAGFREISVAPVTLASLVPPGDAYEFVSIDAEGVSPGLFMDWLRMGLPLPKCFCVEFDDQRDLILSHAGAAGYALSHETPENLILHRAT